MTEGSGAGGSDHGVSREWAVERVEEIVSTVESEPMPVPVREVWVYGDVALGLDPVERLNVYVTKDLLFKGDADREGEFVESHGIEGVGKTVSAEWADEYPEYLRANANGHAAPEKCLAAHLLREDEPIHLEVCNTGFETNVTQRLEGAKARGDWTELLDPRAACLWVGRSSTGGRRSSSDPSVGVEDGGQRSEEAFRKLREGEFVFPTLPDALGMLGLEDGTAEEAAATLREYREAQEGATVRGDVV